MNPSAADRNADLARIHCLKKELGLSDDEYRDVIFALARVRSAADLDWAGRRRVIDHLARRAPAGRSPLPAEWAWIAGHKEERTLRALMHACARAGLAPGGQVPYCDAMLMQRRGCAQPLRFCNWRDFKFVFSALKALAERRA